MRNRVYFVPSFALRSFPAGYLFTCREVSFLSSSHLMEEKRRADEAQQCSPWRERHNHPFHDHLSYGLSNGIR
jgi:hypothetical protein